ncbi:(d)CMP kinase [Paenibacillus eucommiae]|uniref:(d)CMP kinase n=1 Tax=Paenibacillus eucommiae TaxID=1355755 RepID=A0ABS4J8F3_9BACL|nr:(d)CMP kinase [Paenibacillus eucommiae]MBP1996129.1 cytidylate kinase [Paenibacillus eucommiae]
MQTTLITFDGWAASGKSTCASMLAKHLGWPLLSTGTAHRFNAWLMLQQKINIFDANEVADYLKHVDIYFQTKDGKLIPHFNGAVPAPNTLFSNEVRSILPHVTKIPEVCRTLAQHLREGIKGLDVVAEGHGLGTGIFPEADLKFFCDAPLWIRAKRRWSQQVSEGISLSLEETSAEIVKRDTSDKEREVNAVRKSDDMIGIDTERFATDECLQFMIQAFRLRNLGDGVI